MKTGIVKMHSKFFIIAGIFSASLVLAGVQESFSLEEIEGTHAEINFSVKIGTDEYHISYFVCSDKHTIESPKILITSDSDTKEVTSTKILLAGTCQNFESQIMAKNPYKITFVIAD